MKSRLAGHYSKEIYPLNGGMGGLVYWPMRPGYDKLTKTGVWLVIVTVVKTGSALDIGVVQPFEPMKKSARFDIGAKGCRGYSLHKSTGNATYRLARTK